MMKGGRRRTLLLTLVYGAACVCSKAVSSGGGRSARSTSSSGSSRSSSGGSASRRRRALAAVAEEEAQEGGVSGGTSSRYSSNRRSRGSSSSGNAYSSSGTSTSKRRRRMEDAEPARSSSSSSSSGSSARGSRKSRAFADEEDGEGEDGDLRDRVSSGRSGHRSSAGRSRTRRRVDAAPLSGRTAYDKRAARMSTSMPAEISRSKTSRSARGRSSGRSAGEGRKRSSRDEESRSSSVRGSSGGSRKRRRRSSSKRRAEGGSSNRSLTKARSSANRGNGSMRRRRSSSARHNSAWVGGEGTKVPALSFALLASKVKTGVKGGVDSVVGVMGEAKHTATSATRQLQREVKVYTSGTYEAVLLKATRPDEEVDDSLVSTLVAAVNRFEMDADLTKNSAQRRVLLHKLWMKMAEPDCRTKLKALFILHRIFTSFSEGGGGDGADQDKLMKRFLHKLGRETCRKTDCLYFDLDVLFECDRGGGATSVVTKGHSYRSSSGRGRTSDRDQAYLQSFVRRYGSYVLQRSTGFGTNLSCKEMRNLKKKATFENTISAFVKYRKALDSALACMPSAEEEQALTVRLLESVTADMQGLFQHYHTLVGRAAWLDKGQGEKEEEEEEDAAVDADAESLRAFKESMRQEYADHHERVSGFLRDAAELLAVYGLEDTPAASAAELLPEPHDFGDDHSSTNVELGASPPDGATSA